MSIWDAENAAQMLASYYRKTKLFDAVKRVIEAFGEVVRLRAGLAEPMVGQAWLEGYARLCEEHGQKALSAAATLSVQSMGPKVIESLKRTSVTIDVPPEERRDHLCLLLPQELGAYLEFEVPTGGMALWLKSRGEVDLDAWIRHAKECGLLLKPPSHFYLSEPSSCTRMGFSQVDEAGLTEAVQRLKQALVKIGRR